MLRAGGRFPGPFFVVLVRFARLRQAGLPSPVVGVGRARRRARARHPSEWIPASELTQGQSGVTFTIFTGVDSNGDGSTGSDRPNVGTGSLTWDDGHQGFADSGYVTVPLGTNGLPLTNSLGNGTLGRNTERAAALLEHRPQPDEALRRSSA